MISVENATFTLSGCHFPDPEERVLRVCPSSWRSWTQRRERRRCRTMIGLQKWDSGRTLNDGTPFSSMSTWALGRVLSYAAGPQRIERGAHRPRDGDGRARPAHAHPSLSPEREERRAPRRPRRGAPPTWPRCPGATHTGRPVPDDSPPRASSPTRASVFDEPRPASFPQPAHCPRTPRAPEGSSLAVIMNTHHPAQPASRPGRASSPPRTRPNGLASSVMNATPSAALGDVAIGKRDLRGEDVQLSFRVRLTSTNPARRHRRYLVTFFRRSDIFCVEVRYP